MRLFVALEPEKEVLDALQNLQQEAKEQLPQHSVSDERKATAEHIRTAHSPWRMIDGDKMHLTLQFLGGNITHHKIEEIKPELQKIEHPSFEIECRGVGAFAHAQGAKILWAGAKSEGLEGLVQKVRQGMRNIGIEEDNPFSPHITIARCKFPSNISEFVQKNQDRLWHDKKWKVDSFSLIESVHVLGGHEYQELQKYRLL